MDYEKLIRGLLSGPYKMDEGKMSEIFNQTDETSALAEILSADKERISKLKPADDGTSTKFQEGYAKAKKEDRTLLEKELKEEYGIESDLKGKELIEHIVTTKAAEWSKKKPGAETTEDEIKASKVYRDMEKKFKADIAEKETAWAAKLEETEKGFQRKEVLGSFKSEALKVLDELKPILPKGEKQARTLRETFAREFDGYEIRKEDDGFVILKDGKVLDDGHGNSINWKELVTSKAGDFFEFQSNNGGSNAGNSNDTSKGGNNGAGGAGTAKGYPGGIKKPSSLSEYSALVGDRSIPLEQRQQIKEAWNAESGRTE